MKVLIVDDEHLARKRLNRMFEELPDYEVVAEAESGFEAVKHVNAFQPDIVILDIRMPGMDGLEAAKQFITMENPPAVIFCTAYGEHALEAFDVEAVAYLLKPVRREDLEKSLEKAKKLNRVQLAAIEQTTSGSSTGRKHISAKTHKGLELIPVDEICYFLADHKYVTVRYNDSEVLVDDTLKELEKEFEGKFIRVHRNALVSVDFLEGLDRDSSGHYQIRLRGVENKLVVSRRHVSGVKKVMHNL